MADLSSDSYQVIVVGAGHAGVEACLSSARLGVKTLLITTNLDRIAYMSCNPSIGGLAKGHMVREIDILGGEMGLAADETCIQYKRLNSSKGPAVRGTRVQSDKDKYSAFMTEKVLNQKNLSVIQGEVKRLVLEGSACRGVVLQDGSIIHSNTVVITTGTFMNGVMHIGLEQSPGGRVGDQATVGLSDQLRDFGFTVQRLKTGTPARLLNSSIDWSKTVPQYGDTEFFPFSLRTETFPKLKQIACFLSRTTEQTHDIIRKNLDKSPMFCGVIEGVGPRYCPSIEDKITRFADKESHQTFLEPEGLDSDLIYLQGISTSLPADVQYEFLRTIPGLENVKIVRPGYAVEYDFVEPTQIYHRLETRTISNLFLAGQINGTSGYEEAAAQGFVAGINAAHKVLNRDEFILDRDQAYIGVLIDDLVTKGTKEPYRMFTSRAEHRLVLREDNTLDRLFDISLNLKLSGSALEEKMIKLKDERQNLLSYLRSERIFPNEQTQNKILEMKSAPLLKPATYEEFLRRPEINYTDFVKKFEIPAVADPQIFEPVEIEIKYSGYIKRQLEIIDQQKRLERMNIPESTNYSDIKGLSSEERDKLSRVKPRTLGQAQRISGVNPSAIQSLMIFLKGRKKLKDLPSDNSEDRSSHGQSVETR